MNVCEWKNNFMHKQSSAELVYNSEPKETISPLVAPLQQRSIGLTRFTFALRSAGTNKWLALLAKQQMSLDIPNPYPPAQDKIPSNFIPKCSRLQKLVRAPEIWQQSVNRHRPNGMAIILHLSLGDLFIHIFWGGIAAFILHEQSQKVFLRLSKCLYACWCAYAGV